MWNGRPSHSRDFQIRSDTFGAPAIDIPSKQRKYCAVSVAGARALSTKPKTWQAKTTSGPLKIAISS